MDTPMEKVAPTVVDAFDGSAVAKTKKRKRKMYAVVNPEGRRFLRSDAAKLRQESENYKERVREVAVDVACLDSHSCITNERISELNKCSEEVEVLDKGIVFDIEQNKEDQDANKDDAEVAVREKKNAEVFSSEHDNKMKVESSNVSDSLAGKYDTKRKVGRKRIIRESNKHGVEMEDEDDASDSESVVPAASPRDGPVDKSERSVMQRKNTSLEHPENETGKGGNDVKEKVAGVFENQIKVQRNSGTSRILRSSTKMLGELGSVLPESKAEVNALWNDVSAVLTGKDQLKKAGSTAGERKPLTTKRSSGFPSPETKWKPANPAKKSEVVVKRERLHYSEFSSKFTQNACRTEKQKLREQIKTLLLDAGWKIDLRPRKGKISFDSVYIPPKGYGLWSITKAYEVYLSQLQPEHDCKGKRLLNEPSRSSKGKKGSFKATTIPVSLVPLEVVSMLRRKTFTKRRTKNGLEAPRKKVKQIEGKHEGTGKVKGAINGSKFKCIHTDKASVDKKLVLKASTSSSTKACLSSQAKKIQQLPGRKKKNKRGCALLVRSINQEAETSYDDYVPYAWKRTVLSWMIDLGVVSANGKVKYMNKRRTRAILEGKITRDGILCSCCGEVVTVSNFECHAGSKLRQPFQNIWVEEAEMSLLNCQLSAWAKQEESERKGFYSIDITGDDPNDDTCAICGDGGDLICCDCCPSTFHLCCLNIEMLPPGEWHCTFCSCRFCGLASETSQQIDSDVPQTLSCLQCEEKFHHRCIPEADSDPRNSGISCISFCGQTCKKLFESLRSLLGIKHDMEDGFSWSLVQRVDGSSSNSFGELDQRVECNSKVAVALGVMEECFLPIIDKRSGINLIHNVVYNCGSNFNRLNYTGFYTFILERDDEIISTACVRIHGTRLAEMPFIGTRNMYRRQGMCRRLLNGIEEALRSLNIRKLIIPAISELLNTWTNIFGFKALDTCDKEELKSANVLVFPDTGLLSKPLLTKESSPPCGNDNGADKVECKDKCNQASRLARYSLAYTSEEAPSIPEKQSTEAIENDNLDLQISYAVNIRLEKDAIKEKRIMNAISECLCGVSDSETTDAEAQQIDSLGIKESVAKDNLESDSIIQDWVTKGAASSSDLEVCLVKDSLEVDYSINNSAVF